MTKVTMFDQWSKIKDEYENAIVLFRTGRFYEMLELDAYITNQLVGLEMSYRKKGRGGKIPMVGFTPDSFIKYTTKLTEQRLNYVVVEQLHERENDDGILKRQVESVVTRNDAILLSSFIEDYERYLIQEYPLVVETKLLEEAKRNSLHKDDKILAQLQVLDLDQITGIEALKLLDKWQKMQKN